MEYLVAVSSEDGELIAQHFGHTRVFTILKVEDNLAFYPVESREVIPHCHVGPDDYESIRAMDALRDCKYVISAKIGKGAQATLQSRGITPLEIQNYVNYAMEKVMIYDQKFKFGTQERRS